MPRTTKVADLYQKRGEIHRKEKTAFEKLGEIAAWIVGIIIVLAIIGAVT